MKRAVLLLLVLLSCLIYYYLAYFLERTQFVYLFGGVLLLFLGMIGLYYHLRSFDNAFEQVKWAQLLGVLFRVLVLFSVPNLSDDFYRFLWDGKLLLSGVNPYLHIPSDWMQNNTVSEVQKALYYGMNSKSYYTVYPALDQFIFAISAQSSSIYGGIVLMKGLLFIAELLTIILLPKLLSRLSIKPIYSLFYILNPLVILEGIGNLHFEVLTVLFLIVTFKLLLSQKFISSALAFSMAVSVKFIPLLLVPAIVRFIGWKKALSYFSIAGLVFMALFLPFYEASFFNGISDSLGLYFHSFEFNASIYYVLRYFGYLWKGYNMIQVIGLVMALIVLITAILLAFKIKKDDAPSFFTHSFFIFLIFYLCSTTVHPWYILNVLLFALLSGYHRSITVWTFLAFLSYQTYSSATFHESNYLLLLEYFGLMAAMVADWYLHKIRNVQTL